MNFVFVRRHRCSEPVSLSTSSISQTVRRSLLSQIAGPHIHPAHNPPLALQCIEQVERPSLFTAIARCLARARQDQPVGGEVSPLLWW